ncbi:tRNA (guanine(9)-N(1))-methyltransferase, partial [Linderina pennispora]
MSDSTKPAENGNGPAAKKSLSVNDYVPTGMALEEFHKLSRNQQKKVMQTEQWALHADEYKEKQREKARESRKRKRARQADTRPQEKVEQTESTVRIVLDMDFDDKMNDKEVKSMCSQVMRCYAVNRQAKRRVNLHITKLHGRGSERFATALKDHKMWSKEHITFDDREYIDRFQKDELVYLTADSDNVVEELDQNTVYVVGGIVDKNRYPKLTLDKAQQQGIRHARLPIGEYVKMSTRKVMT